MRVVFMGSGAFGVPTLERLRESHELVGVVSQPDKPAGRRSKLTPTPVSAWLEANEPGVDLIRPSNVNDEDVVSRIHAHMPDALVIIAFGQKLGPALLRADSSDPLFACNLHASLLPRWRGAGPVQWTILGGDKKAGSSVITIASAMDAGDVLAAAGRPLDPMTTAGELHDQLSVEGAPLVMSTLEDFGTASLSPQIQDASKVTIARKLKKTDGEADFSLNATEMQRKIHGLNPWPCVTAVLGEKPLKLLRAKPESSTAEQQPGSIIDAEAGTVACGGGSVLKLIEVQPAGSKPMPWADFARGHRPRAGERLESP